MPKHAHIRKVLVIGSGPIVIGQAAEFDYAGTQACRALKRQGVEVVLVNSNPATIMTDPETADAVYVEPLTKECLTRVIRKERPDGLLATLGGQTGLNLAVELVEDGVLEREGVRLMGTDIHAIKGAEDRDLFRELMKEIGQPVPESDIVHSVEEAVHFALGIGYPVIVRPAYTLGGTGGGIAHSEEELRQVTERALRYSPIRQALVEKSVAGFKEIEFEVLRDSSDHCIAVCHMENVDPVGVHTGDSIVVAPVQTLADRELNMLRTASLDIIRKLGIEGGCNVQFALDPHSDAYYVIEVNPRLSRSSALASKATGYPIAKVATLIALGYTLNEIVNPVTGRTTALFEPSLDYIVTKIPRWPFDKFPGAERRLGTQMKATGEVMAIGRTFAESLQKAVRSLELETADLLFPPYSELDAHTLDSLVQRPHDMRLFALAEALRRGKTVDELHQQTGIDRFFLAELEQLVKMERELQAKPLTEARLYTAKRYGFSDETIARLSGRQTEDVRALRRTWRIQPVYKCVDTCAGEFAVESPYYYSTYEREDEVETGVSPSVIVVGSGPIRIGQGIEFDYATVHAVQAIREAGYEAVIVNNNPETVSTDFDMSDRLYFEPLHVEDVLHVVEREKPLGVVVQFGGQTSLNLARELDRRGVPLLGTSMESLHRAEDREQFERLLKQLGIRRPPGVTVASGDSALSKASALGYPVLVRPSYVLGGRAMQIVHSEQELEAYLKEAVKLNPESPVLIDRYLQGKEIEVDAVCDGEHVLVPGIMEHVEQAGVHSGDSIAVYPSPSLSGSQKAQVVEITARIARELNVRGLLNIQFVLFGGELYVLEVNPRASRTVPFMSKVTGLPIARLATRVMLGESLEDLGLPSGLWPEKSQVAVKVPVFSFAKLSEAEVTLGPEMKSTGEVMGRDVCFTRALYKGFRAANMSIPPEGTVLVTVSDKDKADVVPLARRLDALGYRLLATKGTAKSLRHAGFRVTVVPKLSEGSEDILQLIQRGEVDLVVNTWTQGREPKRDGFRIRRTAVENGVPCLTSLDTLDVLLMTLEGMASTPTPLSGELQVRESAMRHA